MHYFLEQEVPGTGTWQRALRGQHSLEEHPFPCHEQLRFGVAAFLHFWYFQVSPSLSDLSLPATLSEYMLLLPLNFPSNLFFASHLP